MITFFVRCRELDDEISADLGEDVSCDTVSHPHRNKTPTLSLKNTL